MKTISKLVMLLAFVAFANTLVAGGNLKVNILPLTSETAVVAISTIDASNLQISIENNKGEKVYYKEINADSKDYRKVFDFSKLEKGEYKLSVSTNGITSGRTFRIDNESIAVGKEKSLIEPYFSFKDGILKMSYLNFQEENTKLNLYTDGNLVYSKEIGDKFNIIEGFDLTKLEEGAYSVEFLTDNESYSYSLDLK